MFKKVIGDTKEVVKTWPTKVGCVYPNNLEIDGGGSYFIHSNLGKCECIEVSDGGHFYAEKE